MFKISKLADYATVIMHQLALNLNKPQSATQLAQLTGLGLPTVSKLLKQLHEADLVNSVRGSTGGYELSRLPEAVSFRDIISAIDGQLALTECSRSSNLCSVDHRCQIRSHWQYLNHVILDVLAKHTLADIL